MTREEAIRELKADYCGNRIICELYPDQCNREDCEIWWAINALENAKNDHLTPESAQNVPNHAFKMQKSDVLGVKTGETCSDTISRQAAIDALDKIFPADPLRNDYTQGITCGAALATEYIKQLPSAQPEDTICWECKWLNNGYECPSCRWAHPDCFERRTDG